MQNTHIFITWIIITLLIFWSKLEINEMRTEPANSKG